MLSYFGGITLFFLPLALRYIYIYYFWLLAKTRSLLAIITTKIAGVHQSGILKFKSVVDCAVRWGSVYA